MADDVRWTQRFNNYIKALRQLQDGVTSAQQRTLNDLEQQGLIQAFEYTHELAWNMMKDFLTDRGNTEIYGSKDATRQAFNAGLISDGEVWMEMIKTRNLTSHTYNEKIADTIYTAIIQQFYPALSALADTFTKLYDREEK